MRRQGGCSTHVCDGCYADTRGLCPICDRSAINAGYPCAGCGDITTRQNFQLRGIELPDVPEIFEGLERVGLTSIQSGMDNVRNAVGNPLAGIDPIEVVDTIPICNDLNEYITAKGQGNRRISNLPRKWNVCVVGSQDLYEHPHINDVWLFTRCDLHAHITPGTAQRN